MVMVTPIFCVYLIIISNFKDLRLLENPSNKMWETSFRKRLLSRLGKVTKLSDHISLSLKQKPKLVIKLQTPYSLLIVLEKKMRWLF